MAIRLKSDMLEATRLTREGRLTEAMAVIRGALTDGSGGDADSTADENAKGHTLKYLAPSFSAKSVPALPASSENPAAAFSPQMLGGFLGSLGNYKPSLGMKGLAGRFVKTPPLPASAGARFEEHMFANAAGSRSYKLYVPSGYEGRALPLVVMLHGCTQSPDDFAAGTRMNELAEKDTFLVAYPAQTQAANPSKCWNWFYKADQQRDMGEPSLIAGITHQIMNDYPVDAGRIYIAGLSAGGAAAAIMGHAYPDLYAAVGVHSGLACGAAHDLTSAFAAMRSGGNPVQRSSPFLGTRIVPTIVFHGDADTTVNPVNGDYIIAQLKDGTPLKKIVQRDKPKGGIGYTKTIETDETGRPLLEHWVLHGAGHAWSGGSKDGTFADPRGPDASREMIRFFLQHPREAD